MPKETIVRADDFVAATYENWAAQLPRSQKKQADQFRRFAKAFRESGRPGMIVLPEKGEPRFIEPVV